MLEEHGATWGDKVKIIGISIDQGAEAVKKHVEAKGWEKVTHYWRGDSDCSKQYGVQGVPNVMLIDTKGNIVFKGHPASRPDLVKDFNELLEGKVPEGCVAPTAGGDGPAMPAIEGGDHNLDDIMKTVDAFASEGGKKLQADCKEDVAGFPRAFCVMVTSVTYDGDSDSFKTKFTNYRVLVGPGDKVDTVNEKIKAMFSGEESNDWFKIEERCHKM